MNLSNADKKWVDGIWEKISEKIEKNAVALQDIIPYMTTDGKYTDMSKQDVGWWTNGFFGGMMWLMYKETNKECFKITAENQSDENVYVSSVKLNGVEQDGIYVTHEQLMAGGELVFKMSNTAK